MTWDALPVFAASLVAVAVFWALPHRFAQDGFALMSVLGLYFVSPFSVVFLVGSVLIVQQAMVLGDAISRRGLIASLCIAALTVAFFSSRESEELFGSSWVVVGIAYWALRHIHVLIEYYLRRISVPTLGDYARYHLLLPVLLAGPIHRLPHFQRQCERRRWSAEEFFSGAERMLLGFALIIIFGEYAGSKVEALIGAGADSGFGAQWLSSVLDWVRLYARFEGLTSIALGLCLMIGLRLEENFNQPWRARSLVDFWTRWHITLSLWCRDYVFLPVAAIFRSPLIGVFCAMVVLGLWHATTIYYFLWALYQATGIVLSQLYLKAGTRYGFALTNQRAMSIVAPLLILAWLSAAKPLILLLLSRFGL